MNRPWCRLCRKKALPGIQFGRELWHMHVVGRKPGFLMLNNHAVEDIIKKGVVLQKDSMDLDIEPSPRRKLASPIRMCRSCSAIVRKYSSVDEKEWPRKAVIRYYNCKPCNIRSMELHRMLRR